MDEHLAKIPCAFHSDKAKKIVGLIEKTKQELEKLRSSLRETVQEHKAERQKLALQTLRDHAVSWCTECLNLEASESLELIFIEGTEQVDGPRQTYGYRTFADLHRMCQKCAEKAFNRHGWRGSFDTAGNNQEYFYAYRVEAREDGHFAKKFGTWVRLDDERCCPMKIQPIVVRQIARRYGLPPQINLDGIDNIVFNEQYAEKVAAQ